MITMYNNILSYWYNLEYFSPFWPTNDSEAQKVQLQTNEPLIWAQQPENEVSYSVFLGQIDTDTLITTMIQAVGESDERLEKDKSKNCICGLKVTNDGKYVQQSYSVATFVWAIAQITNAKHLNVPIDDAQLEEFNAQMDEELTNVTDSFTVETLQYIIARTCEKLQVNLVAPTALIFEKKPIIGDEDTQIDMIPSFYTEDLKRIRASVRRDDRIVSYINAAAHEGAPRIEIDRNVEEMKKWVRIDKYPLGKWPSKYSPSLMQQLSINLAIQENINDTNIFSVNGPPGTGKTTLLKEVIAHNVVERALKLAQYNTPDDAFQKQAFEEPPNDYLQTYYTMDKELTKHGFIVASNNNAAVENVSKELPVTDSVKDAHTARFAPQLDDIYFTDIATNMMDEPSWGLISARLGRKANISAFTKKLWFSKEGKHLRHYFDEPVNWEKAKQNFQEKYRELLAVQEEITQKVKDVHDVQTIVQQIKRLEVALQKSTDAEHEQEAVVMSLANNVQTAEQQIEAFTQSERQLKSRIPWYKKLFMSYFKKDTLVQQYTAIVQQVNDLIAALPNEKQQVYAAEAALTALQQETNRLKKHLDEQQDVYNAALQKIEAHKSYFGKSFAGEEFWRNIEQNEVSQGIAPWTTVQFDTIREELFYLALQLHKAFITNSKRVKQNINCLINMWNGAFLEADKQRAFGSLLNTLMLIVPVISTTFASVSRFLKYAQKEELGILIIDESGQATPQSAVGAIWRTQKAIIVGDPLQVEPVMTIPKQLIQTFASNLNIHAAYRSTILSVQQLADKINRYGGYRNTSEGDIWLGSPLVVHRRCVEPMFSISNDIAYNSRMFKQTMPPKDTSTFLFKTSQWIDIKGAANGGKDHFVAAQGKEVVKYIKAAMNEQQAMPNLYVISPFKTVVEGLKRMLKVELATVNMPEDVNVKEWIKTNCGTVHTFQGKEANEVILLLGCDVENGDGAANWASAKPNILNVAATRAKYRLVIVGDTNLWKSKSGFDVAYEKLNNCTLAT